MKKHNPWKRFLRTLVRDRQLTAGERMASRIGYMGAGFLMAGQWTVEPILFMIGFCCVLVQVFSRKQWNLVVLQLNLSLIHISEPTRPERIGVGGVVL